MISKFDEAYKDIMEGKITQSTLKKFAIQNGFKRNSMDKNKYKKLVDKINYTIDLKNKTIQSFNIDDYDIHNLPKPKLITDLNTLKIGENNDK